MQAQPGTYALVLVSAADVGLPIGKFGELHVRPGFYIYVGSAFGPGGLKARLAHHRHISRRPRWHIDYLRAVTRLEAVWYTYDPARREHQWSEVLSQSPNAAVPLPGFGSSDCRCASHLYFFETQPSVSAFRRRLRGRFKRHARIIAKSGSFFSDCGAAPSR
ncbi:MAG: GIY-YIG nuclease family protein [Desulfobacterales bacterium]|nr:MAG: GIY-YIG nuclease family protein [Desulfobacterales bacterium]